MGKREMSCLDVVSGRGMRLISLVKKRGMEKANHAWYEKLMVMIVINRCRSALYVDGVLI